jgi:2',3'-cyclic-nucleotide 2'-phosphodiesterase/3'-nucleotidase
MPDVDNARGFIHGKPAVMGNMWGKSLGVIALALEWQDGRWRIDAGATHSEVRNIRTPEGKTVAADPRIFAAVKSEHEGTVAYVSSPIGHSEFPLTTYFAAVGDVSALQAINTAQREYAQRFLAQNRPDLKNVPVISAAAPFKLGFGGATDFTAINEGPLAIRNAADLYLYPNTLSAVRLNGIELRQWLEKSASYFNRIDPASKSPQELVNRKVPSFNFDVIQGGIRYAIRLDQPVGSRIMDLEFRDRPVRPDQDFVLVTNNYRASGGGDFPGSGDDHVLFHAPDMNRSVLIDWFRQRRQLRFETDGADRSWRFHPLDVAGPVVFHSASGKLGLAHRLGLRSVRLVREDGNGMSTYAIDLGVPD